MKTCSLQRQYSEGPAPDLQLDVSASPARADAQSTSWSSGGWSQEIAGD